MKYWRGVMWLDIDDGWQCDVCDNNNGDASLTWGFVHAQCRCDHCHTQYRMLDENGKAVTKPICQLKPEFREPLRDEWKKRHVPWDEWPDGEFQTFADEVLAVT